MRISDWSSDVCSSDLGPVQLTEIAEAQNIPAKFLTVILSEMKRAGLVETLRGKEGGYWLARPPEEITYGEIVRLTRGSLALVPCAARLRSEEHTSELQSLMRISYAVFCLKKTTQTYTYTITNITN